MPDGFIEASGRGHTMAEIMTSGRGKRSTGTRKYKYGIRAPIVVYQMGKVGSMSIYSAFQKLELDVPVYHCHVLNQLGQMERNVKLTLTNPGESLQVIREGKQLRRRIFSDDAVRWNLVTLVREPIGRNVSHFFHGIIERVPDFYQRLENKTLEMGYLADTLLKDSQVNLTCMWWFDTQVKQLFDIDVYAKPFPKRRGYEIYEGRHVRMLLLRLESLDRCLGTAMKQFLGIPNFTADRQNVAEDKDYAEAYRRFKEAGVLPLWYPHIHHSSRYARHFYTPAELRRFRKPWLTASRANAAESMAKRA